MKLFFKKQISILSILSGIFVLSFSACTQEYAPDRREEWQLSLHTLHGTWVDAEYAQWLTETQSPYGASLHVPYHLLFVDTTLIKDSMLMVTEQRYGLADPSVERFFRFSASRKFELSYSALAAYTEKKCSSDCDLLDFRIDETDTIVVFRTFDTLIGAYRGTEYLKIPTPNTTGTYMAEFDAWLNRQFLAGEYRQIPQQNMVVFSEDGSVDGLGNQRKALYWNFFDDIYAACSFDVVELFPDDYGSSPYVPSILTTPVRQGDTLRLYALKKDSGKYIKDTCLYTLIKLSNTQSEQSVEQIVLVK